MNAYISDQIAREHANQLMADAAAWRRQRAARLSAKARVQSRRTGGPGRDARTVLRPVRRPLGRLGAWFAAGHL